MCVCQDSLNAIFCDIPVLFSFQVVDLSEVAVILQVPMLVPMLVVIIKIAMLVPMLVLIVVAKVVGIFQIPMEVVAIEGTSKLYPANLEQRTSYQAIYAVLN